MENITCNVIRGATVVLPPGGSNEATINMPNMADMILIAFNLTVDDHPMDALGTPWPIDLIYLEVDKGDVRMPDRPISGKIQVYNLFGSGSNPGVIPHRIPIQKDSEIKFSFNNRDTVARTVNVTVYAAILAKERKVVTERQVTEVDAYA